jgi:hypothetical protein
MLDHSTGTTVTGGVQRTSASLAVKVKLRIDLLRER